MGLWQMATFSKMPDGHIVFVYGKWPPFLKWQRATLLLFVNGKPSLKMADGHSYFYGQWPQGMIQSFVMADTTYKC